MWELRENKKNFRVFGRNSQCAAEHIRQETEEIPFEIPSVMLEVMWLRMKQSEKFKIGRALDVILYICIAPRTLRLKNLIYY
jgi:hypothetical protein